MASPEANSKAEFEKLLATAPSAMRPAKPVPLVVRRQKYKKAPIHITNLYDENVDYVVNPKAMPKPKPRPKRSKVRHEQKRTSLHQLGFKSYEEYLQSDDWLRKKRQLFKSERPYACISCGKTRGLHVHHRTYERIGNEMLEDLDYLCERCHELAHRAAKMIAGVTLWNCSRKVANLIRLGYGTPRFDSKAYNQQVTTAQKVAQARKSRSQQKATRRRAKKARKRKLA